MKMPFPDTEQGHLKLKPDIEKLPNCIRLEGGRNVNKKGDSGRKAPHINGKYRELPTKWKLLGSKRRGNHRESLGRVANQNFGGSQGTGV